MLKKIRSAAVAEFRGSFLHDLSGTRLVIVLVAAGFFVFLAWGALARVDEVARGEGKVRPSSKAQLIQSAEAATVRSILVQSGQRVRKGELLVRLDDTQSASELGELEAEKDSLQARAARLGGEAQGQAVGCASGASASSAEACADEQRLQQLRAQALASKNSALSASIEQRRREMAEAQATADSLRTSVSMARKQVEMLEPLALKSIVPQTELLQARRELNDTQGRLAAAEQQISRSAAAVREAQAQASEANLQFRQEAMDEMNQLKGKLSVIEQSSKGAAGRVDRMELTSPLDGVVNDVQVTTIGGFVNAGQKIMEVIPVDEKLLIETRVKPKDIAFIRVGQQAIVKVSAYDFSIYGGLPGKVVQVSADSIYDEQTKEAYFNVIVETSKSYLSQGKRRLPITPGMMCTADIITGRKSVLDYLLKPVIKAQSEALRER